MAPSRILVDSRILRLALLGALAVFLVAMLLGERINTADFAVLLGATAFAMVFCPSVASEALRTDGSDSRDSWAALRVAPSRGIPKGILIVLLAGWAVTAGLVLLAFAASVSIPLPLGDAVSGGVLLIAVLEVSLTAWLWTRKRRRA